MNDSPKEKVQIDTMIMTALTAAMGLN